MQRVSEFVFYELSTSVHALTLISENNYFYNSNWSTLWNARKSLDELYSQRPLNFTTPAALRLYNAISAVVAVKFEEVMEGWAAQTSDEENLIPVVRVIEIREAANEFEAMLRTECLLMDTYFISKKGAYSTKDLLENFHQQVPDPSRSELSEQTKMDLDQAGRCIAFDVPTAAAFHLLRGTESVVREYYELLVPGPKKSSQKMRNWGIYIKLMKSCGGSIAAISLLDHMRDVYRNPVTHPEENYTDEKVQVLLGLCISAIVLLKQEIRDSKLGASKLQLPTPSK